MWNVSKITFKISLNLWFKISDRFEIIFIFLLYFTCADGYNYTIIEVGGSDAADEHSVPERSHACEAGCRREHAFHATTSHKQQLMRCPCDILPAGWETTSVIVSVYEWLLDPQVQMICFLFSCLP